MIGQVIAFRDGCERAADKTGILLWKDRFDADWLSLRFYHRGHRDEEANAGQTASLAEAEMFPISGFKSPFTVSPESSMVKIHV